MGARFREESFLSGRERKCPVCGKMFYCTGEWVYRRKEKPLCTYSCCLRWDSEHQTIGDKICQAIDDGLNNAEIRRTLGVTQRQIDYWRERKT